MFFWFSLVFAARAHWQRAEREARQAIDLGTSIWVGLAMPDNWSTPRLLESGSAGARANIGEFGGEIRGRSGALFKGPPCAVEALAAARRRANGSGLAFLEAKLKILDPPMSHRGRNRPKIHGFPKEMAVRSLPRDPGPEPA